MDLLVSRSTWQSLSAHIHGRFDGHAGPQQMLRVLILIQSDSHRESLHDLHVVPGRIFRWEYAEQRTGGARKALHSAFVVAPEGVHPDGDRLAGSHLSELRLFEIGRDPNVVQGNDHEQALTRLDAMAKLNGFSADHAADRRINFGVAEIEL